jgi:uncharacterized phage infection (PIP) family protein YhgE
MSEPQDPHAAPDATSAEEGAPEAPASSSLAEPGGARRLGRVNLRASHTAWLGMVPIVVTLAVLSALAAFYFAGILKPMSNLRHFPIAVVNEDAGPNGARVVKAMQAEIDKDAYDLRVLSRDQAKQQLDTAQIYGAAGIAPNFSSKLQAYRNAVAKGRIDRPTIVVLTNPRAGAFGAGIAGQALTRAAEIVDRLIGRQLSQAVTQQANGASIPGPVMVMLANPIDVKPGVHNALPDGTGDGMSAFYYALLLLLGGFIGSFVVSMVVDSMLGLAPTAFGPVYRLAEPVKVSRFRTLLIKWALMVLLAVLTSAVYILVAGRLGMPIQHGLPLWLFGAFAIAAVGITSTSLIAALGSLGLLVSMFVFVILGLPSAGASVPLQATPPFFGWLARFEPMRQVFLGARALLYFDGQADAGLSQSVELSAIGLVIGLLLGGIVTRLYDRRSNHRIPSEPRVAASAPVESPVKSPAEPAPAAHTSQTITDPTNTDE